MEGQQEKVCGQLVKDKEAINVTPLETHHPGRQLGNQDRVCQNNRMEFVD